MANYIVSDSDLTSVANAIRAKGGTSASLTWPTGFVSAVSAFPDAVNLSSLSITENGTYTASSGHGYSQVTVNIAGSGDTNDEDNLVTKSYYYASNQNYVNNRVSSIWMYTFYSAANLHGVEFGSCKTIGSNAFYNCYNLTNISFPQCQSIGSCAFYSCSALTTLSFPSCVSVSASAFYSCTSVESAYFPKLKTIAICAFYANSKLVQADFPSCTSLSASALAQCKSLKNISFPLCTTVGSYAFQYCTKLESAYLPECTTLNSYAFQYCSNISLISLPKVTTINMSAFHDCSKLLSVYLFGTSVARLNASTAFSRTPIANYTGYTGGVVGSIYVRASLLTAFQSATNWTYFSSRFVGLTDEEIAELDAQLEGA